MAAIRTRGPGRDGPQVAEEAPPSGGTGCGWLMVAAARAGLADSNVRVPPDPASGRGHLQRIATRRPGTGAGSVRQAREFTHATLQRWGMAERTDDIAVVISELLTNALRHGLPAPGDARPRPPIQLGLLQPGPCVLCAVTDPSTTAPVPLTPGFLAETGRGLHIICALSDRWGYATLSNTGKVVWATFTIRPGPSRPAQ